MPGQQGQDSLKHRLVGNEPSCPFSKATFEVFLINPFLEIPYKGNIANLVFSPRENLFGENRIGGGEEKEMKVL